MLTGRWFGPTPSTDENAARWQKVKWDSPPSIERNSRDVPHFSGDYGRANGRNTFVAILSLFSHIDRQSLVTIREGELYVQESLEGERVDGPVLPSGTGQRQGAGR